MATHEFSGGGYCIFQPPTPGIIRLHHFRTFMARYRALGPHTVITAAVRVARIAFRAAFQSIAPGW